MSSLSVPHHNMTHSRSKKCHSITRGRRVLLLASICKTDSVGFQQKTDGTGECCEDGEFREGTIYKAVGGQGKEGQQGRVSNALGGLTISRLRAGQGVATGVQRELRPTLWLRPLTAMQAQERDAASAHL